MSASASTTNAAGEPPAALEIPIELRVEDVVSAHFWTLRQLPATRVLLGVNALVALGVILILVRALSRSEPLGPSLAGIAVLTLLFALLPFQVRRRAHQRFANMSEGERRGTYTFTPDGFEWSMGRAPGKLPWNVVSKTADTDDYIYLMTPLARTHVIPKRSLAPHELDAVRKFASGL